MNLIKNSTRGTSWLGMILSTGFFLDNEKTTKSFHLFHCLVLQAGSLSRGEWVLIKIDLEIEESMKRYTHDSLMGGLDNVY